jgi:hypothetical protein
MHNIVTKSQTLLLYRPIRWSVVFNVLIIAMLAVVFDIRIVPDRLPVYVPILLFFIWCMSAFFIGGNLIVTLTRSESVWWIVILVWESIYVLLGFSNIGINNIFVRITVYSLPVIMSFVIRKYYYREKVLLFVVLFLVILFNIVKNDIIGYYNPWMYKSLTTTRDGFAASSTTFTAVSLFFFAVCFLLLKNKTSKFVKLASWFSIGATSYYFFVLNSRGTAFFLFLILLVGFLSSPKRSFNNIKPLHLFLTVLSLILFFFLLFNPFMNAINVVFAGNERMVARLSDLTYFAQSQDLFDSGSVGSRMELSLISLHTWFGSFTNFFFGIGEHAVYNVSMAGLSKAGVGQHSQFFDHLARYGLLGGLILYKALKNTFSFVLRRTRSTKMYNRIFVVFLVFSLYSFLNNSMIGNILFVVFLEFPLVVDIIENKENMSYE